MKNMRFFLLSSLYRDMLVPMGTNCVPYAAAVLLFCYKKDIMLSLSDKIRQMLLKHSILLQS